MLGVPHIELDSIHWLADWTPRDHDELRAMESFRRIVQTPGGITMYYDVGQGQGFQRNIVMNGSPHLPAHIRQWWGDSRGHWEGDTLVVDVTNFGYKSEFQGARENLHLVERWTRMNIDGSSRASNPETVCSSR